MGEAVTPGVYITSGISHERLARALAAVGRERAAQVKKWGEQHHLDGTGPRVRVLEPTGDEGGNRYMATMPASALADAAREACKANGAPDRPDTWAAILLEEVFEALAEDDPVLLRGELVQIAAVAVQWVEEIDRRLEEARDVLGEQP
jgi:hypothetical protein